MKLETSVARGGRPIDLTFWLPALLLVLALGLWLAGHMTLLQWDNDEGIFAISGWAIAKGYRPFADFWIEQPPGGAALLAAVYQLVGPSLAASRRAMLLLALCGTLGVALLARRLGGRVAGLVAIPLLILSPHFFWLSRSLNLDLPSLALAVLGLDAAWRYRDAGGRRWLALAGVLLGLGISIKLHAVLLAAPIGLLVIQRAWAIEWARDVNAPWTRRWSSVAGKSLLDGLILLAGALACVAAWFLFAPPAAVLDAVLGVAARARDAYPSRSSEYALWLFRDNLFGENLGLFALAIFGFAWLLRRRRADAAVMALWCAVTGFALITQRPMWPKHHWSLVLWPLAVLAGVGVSALAGLAAAGASTVRRDGWRALRPGAWGMAGCLAAVVWMAALPATVRRLRELANPRQFAAVADGLAWIEENLPRDAVVISDNGLLPFITGRRTPPSTAVISSKRIRIGDLTAAELIDAAESSKADAVMIWNNHLTDFGDFMAYLPTRYLLERVVGDDREIWRRFDPGRITNPQPNVIYDVATFEGFDLPQQLVRPGQVLPLTLYWRAAGPTSADLTVFVHLVDAAGRTVAQADGPPAGGAQPSSSWVPGEIVVDPRPIALPVDLPRGAYRVQVGYYDPATLRRSGAAQVDGPEWPDGAVELVAPVIVQPESGQPVMDSHR